VSSLKNLIFFQYCRLLLLDLGINIEIHDSQGWSLLMWAANNGHSKVVELLLNGGARINDSTEKKPDSSGWTPLMLAAGGGP
jgi:ankyrin repeat protein